MQSQRCLQTLGLLLDRDNYNVPVTVATIATIIPDFGEKWESLHSWKLQIESIISENLSTSGKHTITVTVVKGSETSRLYAKGSLFSFVDRYWFTLWDADGIRFRVFNGEQEVSWIIVRP